MNFRTSAVLFWACLLGTAAVAGEQNRTRIEIVVDDDVSGQQSFSFDSQDAGFDLDSMAVGETRVITDESGNVADVRRTDDGFEFEVNGQTIDLTDLHELDGLHGEHDIEVHLDDAEHDAVVVSKVKKVKKVKMIKTDQADGVTVISGSQIDAATRDRIREVLQSSGQQGEVLFIDGSEFDVDSDTHAHGAHEVRIIKKEVNVTN